MTGDTSVADKLRAVARLRALCQRLPHIPTEAESRLLARFQALAAHPAAATTADVDALVAGWRSWWREKRTQEIAAMADAVSPDLVEGDRWLATYALGARLALGRQT
jgi:hypothetical protein